MQCMYLENSKRPNPDLDLSLQSSVYLTIQSLPFSGSFQLNLVSSVTLYGCVNQYSVPMMSVIMSRTEFFNTSCTVKECSKLGWLPLQLLEVLSLFASNLASLGLWRLRGSRLSSTSIGSKGVDENAPC